MQRWAMVGVAVTATCGLVACSDRSAAPATTLAPFVTAVTTTTTTEPPSTSTTRVPNVTLPPDTTTSTSTTTTTTTLPGQTTSTSTTAVPRAAALVLRDDGLGDARFGAEPESVISYVTSIIGRPTADSGWADPFQFGT